VFFSHTKLCSAGNQQQCFFSHTKSTPASQQYFFHIANQHQPPTTRYPRGKKHTNEKKLYHGICILFLVEVIHHAFVHFEINFLWFRRAWAPNYQQNRDTIDSLDSSNCGQKGASPAMSTLQRYYGLSSQKGSAMDCSTEMSVYRKGGFQSNLSETLLSSSAAPGTKGTDGSWEYEEPVNRLSSANGANGNKSNGVPKPKQDASMRRRQKAEAESNRTDIQDDFLADPIKAIKSLLPRPISSIRLNMDTGSPDSSQKSSISFLNLNGFKSVRKSPSAPSFADAENGVSMWSSSKWTFNHESFTRPLLDGLPKPVSGRRMKTALD